MTAQVYRERAARFWESIRLAVIIYQTLNPGPPRSAREYRERAADFSRMIREAAENRGDSAWAKAMARWIRDNVHDGPLTINRP